MSCINFNAFDTITLCRYHYFWFHAERPGDDHAMEADNARDKVVDVVVGMASFKIP